MAYPIGAANIPSFGDLLSPGLAVRADHARYPILHARNSSSTPNITVNLFIDAAYDSYQYAASIITACADQTVYALQCTEGRPYLGTQVCGSNGPIATLTEGASNYAFSSAITTSTLGYDVSATAQETCLLAGTTAATCTATLGGTVDGKSTTTSLVTTATGSDYYRFDVEITGGAEKMANPTATCSKGTAAGVSTKAAAVWSLAGVIGVACVLAL